MVFEVQVSTSICSGAKKEWKVQKRMKPEAFPNLARQIMVDVAFLGAKLI